MPPIIRCNRRLRGGHLLAKLVTQLEQCEDDVSVMSAEAATAAFLEHPLEAPICYPPSLVFPVKMSRYLEVLPTIDYSPPRYNHCQHHAHRNHWKECRSIPPNSRKSPFGLV